MHFGLRWPGWLPAAVQVDLTVQFLGKRTSATPQYTDVSLWTRKDALWPASERSATNRASPSHRSASNGVSKSEGTGNRPRAVLTEIARDGVTDIGEERQMIQPRPARAPPLRATGRRARSTEGKYERWPPRLTSCFWFRRWGQAGAECS